MVGNGDETKRLEEKVGLRKPEITDMGSTIWKGQLLFAVILIAVISVPIIVFEYGYFLRIWPIYVTAFYAAAIGAVDLSAFLMYYTHLGRSLFGKRVFILTYREDP